MKKNLRKNKKRRWSILGPIALISIALSCFIIIYFVFDRNFAVHADSTCVALSDGTGVAPIPNTTFLKSYRMLVFTKIKSIQPTKDGGYIASGTTDPNSMMIPPDGFVAKLNKQGAVSWVRHLKTTNAAGAGNRLGDEDVQSIIELKDGGYLMVSKVWGFIQTAEWSADNTELNKILFTKLNKNGVVVWSKSFTAFVEDAKNSVLETDDKGFLFYAPIVDLAPDDRGEDSDVYQDMPFASLKVLKLDKNGNLLWSKNIKNVISRKNDSYMVQTPDGGYALAGNLTEPNAEKDPPYDYDTYPGLAKFDKDFNFQWAKSLEGTPLEMAAAIPKADGGYELGHTQIRQPAGILHGLVKTPDNGYLVLGTGPTALSFVPNLQELSKGKYSGLIGFKFDASGNMQWARKVTATFNDFTMPMIDFSVSLAADNQILLAGPMTWADEDYSAKTKAVNDQMKWYADTYGELEILKEEKERSKQSQEDYKKVKEVIKIAAEAFRPGIFIMKMDENLNASWAKIINPQHGATNYTVKPTSDSGAVIAGGYTTDVIQSTLFGNITYYEDGFVVKMDGGGNVKDDKNWITDYNGRIVTERMTEYAVSNSLNARVDAYNVSLTNRKPEFSLYKKTKTSSYAPFSSSTTTRCSTAPVTSLDTSLPDVPGVASTPKTWPQINYERATTVDPINEKSQAVHGDVLPILNTLFKNQVKLTDNMSGSMLSYMFDRIVVPSDITAVKKSLESLGYKTQDEGTYQLTMYKVGYFLTLTFSINNTNKAFLEITY